MKKPKILKEHCLNEDKWENVPQSKKNDMKEAVIVLRWLWNNYCE